MVNFATSGLAAGVPITITGDRVNNGGHSVPFTLSFNSPGPSASITTQPGSDIVYFDGFQSQYILTGTVYTLVDIFPTSPFTAGLSGITTTVMATYTSCARLDITSQPVGATITAGESATFSISLADDSSASYQWYKDGFAIDGANDSQYTIDPAWVGDSGSYYVVVSSLCETIQSDTADLTVAKSAQTIDFPQPASPAEYNTSFAVSPSASSGLPVVVQASGGCTIDAGQVTMTSSTQSCTLNASQAGDENYLPASDVVRVVDAAKASQTIDFPQPASPAEYNTSFAVSPSASSGLPVVVQASGGCTIDAGQVTMTSGTQSCTLTASQAGDGNYNAATDVERVVDAAKADQTIDFPQPASPAEYNTSFTVSPSASSGLPVVVQASGGCTIDAGLVTMTSSTQSCTLTASQAGDENYLPADDVEWVVDAAKADQTIDFPQPASPAQYNTSFTVSPSASSGLAVAVQASGGCTIDTGLVTMTSSTQSCTLTASQAGDENYLPAVDVEWVVDAAKASQTIDFPQPASPAQYNTSFTVSPSASSGLAVAVQASGGCTIDAGLVTMTSSTQSCTLTASQAGDGNYLPASDVVRVVVAARASQTIDFPQPPSTAREGTSFLVSLTADSGLPVGLTASGSCSVAGYLVTITQAAGTCTLTASQAGDANYNPAEPVVRTVQALPSTHYLYFPVVR
jgi:hypothetical protein